MTKDTLTIKEESYPNPSCRFGVFFIEGFEIGRADKRGDGWVLPRGRKILSERDAAVAMLKKRVADSLLARTKAAADEAGARMMLAMLRRVASK